MRKKNILMLMMIGVMSISIVSCGNDEGKKLGIEEPLQTVDTTKDIIKIKELKNEEDILKFAKENGEKVLKVFEDKKIEYKKSDNYFDVYNVKKMKIGEKEYDSSLEVHFIPYQKGILENEYNITFRFALPKGCDIKKLNLKEIDTLVELMTLSDLYKGLDKNAILEEINKGIRGDKREDKVKFDISESEAEGEDDAIILSGKIILERAKIDTAIIKEREKFEFEKGDDYLEFASKINKNVVKIFEGTNFLDKEAAKDIDVRGPVRVYDGGKPLKNKESYNVGVVEANRSKFSIDFLIEGANIAFDTKSGQIKNDKKLRECLEFLNNNKELKNKIDIDKLIKEIGNKALLSMTKEKPVSIGRGQVLIDGLEVLEVSGTKDGMVSFIIVFKNEAIVEGKSGQ